jgi:hypothetical protein
LSNLGPLSRSDSKDEIIKSQPLQRPTGKFDKTMVTPTAAAGLRPRCERSSARRPRGELSNKSIIGEHHLNQNAPRLTDNNIKEARKCSEAMFDRSVLRHCGTGRRNRPSAANDQSSACETIFEVSPTSVLALLGSYQSRLQRQWA